MIRRIDLTKCTGCRICVEICPMDVLRLNTFAKEIPSCQAACPAGVNMRGYIYLLNQSDFQGAMKVIRETLPLPAVTGHICFHPCESECARKAVDEAVNIHSLERFVADYALEEKAKPWPRLHASKIAAIGSGPAGLAAAYDLTKMGYPITVFESMPELGGMLRYGIPRYRLPRDVLDAQINYIEDMGVEFRTGVTIGEDLSLDELKDEGYRAILIAVGAHKNLKLNIAGEDLAGVSYGLAFLRDVNSGKRVDIRERVAVIGGGNVAIDSARTALRLGAKQVLVIYRRSRQEMLAHDEDVEAAEGEGIRFAYLTAPSKILGRDGKVDGLECVRMELGPPDASGRRSPVPVKGSEFIIEADTIIPAVGEVPDIDSLVNETTVKTTPRGTIKVNNLSTGVPGIFACGDVVDGASSVVEAIASGKRAAIATDAYLRGKDIKTIKMPRATKVKRPPKEGLETILRHETLLLPIAVRSKNFEEVKLGFDEGTALDEAQRCMTCGSTAYIAYLESCMTCYNCEMRCPYQAASVDPFRKIMPVLITHPEDRTKYDMLYTARTLGIMRGK